METKFRITLEVVFSHTEPILNQECNVLQIYSVLKSLALLRESFAYPLLIMAVSGTKSGVTCVKQVDCTHSRSSV